MTKEEALTLLDRIRNALVDVPWYCPRGKMYPTREETVESLRMLIYIYNGWQFLEGEMRCPKCGEMHKKENGDVKV